MIDKDDYKAMSVLINSYSPVDMADLICDYHPTEVVGKRSLWELSSEELVLLAHLVYPDGAVGLQMDLMFYNDHCGYTSWLRAIDRELGRYGTSTDDLPDFLYRDAYDQEMTPCEVVKQLLRRSSPSPA